MRESFSRITAAMLALALSALIYLPEAKADLIVTFSSSSTTLGSGSLPSESGTYVTADFSYLNAHQVALVLNVTNTVPNLATDSVAFEFASVYASNSTTYQQNSGPTPKGVTFSSSNTEKLPGSGNEQFNSLFDFSGNGGKLNSQNSAKFTITFGTSTDLSKDLSGLLVAGSTTGDYYAGAHLTSFDSGKSVAVTGAISTTSVPEPSALVTGSIGVLLIGFAAAR